MKKPVGNATVAVHDFLQEKEGAYRFIELRRPEKLNCLNLEMLERIQSALLEGAGERVVLTGAGRAFCTGLDLKEVQAPNDPNHHLHRLVEIYRWLLKTEAETVVLAQGYAAGGGAGLVACARKVIVSTDFRFRVPDGKLSHFGAVVIPVCNLRTGGKTPGGKGWLGCDLDAAEAHRLGLVDRVVAPNEMDALIEDTRNGMLAPGGALAEDRESCAVDRALFELGQFLGNR